MDTNRPNETNKGEIERFEVDLGGGLSRKARPPKRNVEADRESWYWVGRLGEVGFAIAIPPVAGVTIGSYLDGKWNTYPKVTLTLLGMGVFIAGYVFVQIIVEAIRRKRT